MSEPKPTDPEPCCHGTCKRKQAPMLMRSGLSNRWYIVLRWKDHGDGWFTPVTAADKHEVHSDTARQLDAAFPSDPT